MAKTIARRTRRFDVRTELIATLATVLPPSSPQPSPYRSQVMGLSLLDTGLRLTHVSRVLEELTYTDRYSLARSVTADIDLSEIPPDILMTLRSEGSGLLTNNRRIWIPIGRHSRVELSAVDVLSQTGEHLPRLPQSVCNDLLAVALQRILRMTLTSSQHAAEEKSEVYRSLNRDHRSIWCLEKAISNYIHTGNSMGARAITRWSKQVSEGHLTDLSIEPDDLIRTLPEDHPQHIRARAIKLLDELFDPRYDPFYELLRVGAGDHLLVVGLPESSEVVQVHYQAPLLRAHHPRSAARLRSTLLRRLIPTGTDFVVDYETTIPRHAKSFHVKLEVHPDISVRSMILSTDDDLLTVEEFTLVESAVADLDESPALHEKAVEHELQSALLSLAPVLEHRSGELIALQSTRHPAFKRGTRRRARRPLNRILDHKVHGEEYGWETQLQTLAELLAASRSRQLGELSHLAKNPAFCRHEQIRRLICNVEDLEIAWGCLLDNDPRENFGHVHWSPTRRTLQQGAATIHARCRMVLADEKPALGESVRRLVLGLAIVVFVLGWFDTGQQVWPILDPRQPVDSRLFTSFAQADAVIAILLLVPTILIGRLDLPSPDSAIGQLRAFSRLIAYSSVGISALLGIAIAAGATGRTLHLWMLGSLSGLLIAGGLVHLDLIFRWVRKRHFALPPGPPVPRWVTLTSMRFRWERVGDAHFSVNTERVRPNPEVPLRRRLVIFFRRVLRRARAKFWSVFRDWRPLRTDGPR
jgi:hypothetical protein